MPGLDTDLHLLMLRGSSRWRRMLRSFRAARAAFAAQATYGVEWGDPDVVEPLRFVRDRYVLPYVRDDRDALEIGPGGGRWTRYLIGCKSVVAVDHHAELLHELRRRIRSPRLTVVHNNGTDFPGVADASIDYVFSFGTFVHLDVPLIEQYLANMRRILKPRANVVLQYADQTKIMAQLNAGFSDNTPERMRTLVTDAGYRILEEDVTTLWHSSVVRFTS